MQMNQAYQNYKEISPDVVKTFNSITERFIRNIIEY